MNRIEPGCLVVITGCNAGHEEILGCQGTAREHVPSGHGICWMNPDGTRDEYFLNEDGWMVALATDGEAYVATRSLLRINGHEPVTSEEEQEACV